MRHLTDRLELQMQLKWHLGLQSHFSGAHPTIWKLLSALKKDAASQKLGYL